MGGGWAKTYLVKAGLLESPRRAFIRLAARGQQALKDTARIDSRYLRRFPEFLKFTGGDGDVKAPDVAQSRDASVIAKKTPEEPSSPATSRCNARWRRTCSSA